MKSVLPVCMALLISLSAYSEVDKTQENQMRISGAFEVNLEPQQDDSAPAGRMVINKKYSGLLYGSGVGQMISKRTSGGVATYYAIEEFEGSVEGKRGSFTLTHEGYMSKESQSLKVKILEGSGTGELENISGSMVIKQQDGNHEYELSYKL